ncbi:MAG: hypothetical protein KAU84_04470 [Thermoplasmatales archaeon]|nr:hypothetical protein [Thermoplasmatales archaeon]
MVYGKTGFIAWFYAVIYNRLRDACKNIYVKLLVHSIGIITIVVGMFYLITAMPSITSIFGMFLVFIGFIFFLIPLGIDSSG